MNRRTFLGLAAGAAIAPKALLAEPKEGLLAAAERGTLASTPIEIPGTFAYLVNICKGKALAIEHPYVSGVFHLWSDDGHYLGKVSHVHGTHYQFTEGYQREMHIEFARVAQFYYGPNRELILAADNHANWPEGY